MRRSNSIDDQARCNISARFGHDKSRLWPASLRVLQQRFMGDALPT